MPNWYFITLIYREQKPNKLKVLELNWEPDSYSVDVFTTYGWRYQ